MNGWIFDPRIALAIKGYITCSWERFILSLTCRAGKKYYFDARILKIWRSATGLEKDTEAMTKYLDKHCSGSYNYIISNERILCRPLDRAYPLVNQRLVSNGRPFVLYGLVFDECDNCTEDGYHFHNLPNELGKTLSWRVSWKGNRYWLIPEPLGNLLE